MSTGDWPLATARAHAEDLLALLAPACERIAIAGSIRRGKPRVGDIEIVAVGRTDYVQVGLWGEQEPVDMLAAQVNHLIATGALSDHPTDPKRGARYQKLMHTSGMQVDLFLTTPDSWGLILLIRTGPADYSRNLVTVMKQGPTPHHSSGGQLHAGAGFVCSGRCTVVPTHEEEDVYEAVGVEWVPPDQRA